MNPSTYYAVLLVLGVGCSPTVEIADPIIEVEIRLRINKPTGELTKADLEKVTELQLGRIN